MKSEQKFPIVPIMILILQIITHEIKKKKRKMKNKTYERTNAKTD